MEKGSKLKSENQAQQHGEVRRGGKPTEESEKGWPKEGGPLPVCGVLDGQ